MALPNSGTLTFAMIKTELGLTGSQSLNDLIQASNLLDKTAPHNIHQFYGYEHDNGIWDILDMTLEHSEYYLF